MRHRNTRKLNIDKLEKRLVSKKFTQSSISTKILSLIVSTCLLIALGIFAYFYAGAIEGKLGIEGEATFTISKALAHGNKPGFIILTLIAFFYLIYLLALRGPTTLFVRRLFFLSISVSFLLSLLWFTPSYNQLLHYSLASIIFSFILFFNLATYYLFYMKYEKDKNMFLLMGLLNMAAYVCLIVFAILRGSLDSDIFAAFEILFSLLFVITILMIGFY